MSEKYVRSVVFDKHANEPFAKTEAYTGNLFDGIGHEELCEWHHRIYDAAHTMHKYGHRLIHCQMENWMNHPRSIR